jgi:hypothetical protein
VLLPVAIDHLAVPAKPLHAHLLLLFQLLLLG